jgi:hypothetical protein
MRRTLAVGLVAVAAVVPAGALASASATRHWHDGKRQLDFDVARGHFQQVRWTCKSLRLVVASWGSDSGPRVHRHGKFAFKAPAKVFDNNEQSGTTTLRMRGRFVKRNGKRRAIGKVRAAACFDSARSFRAKRVSGGY